MFTAFANLHGNSKNCPPITFVLCAKQEQTRHTLTHTHAETASSCCTNRKAAERHLLNRLFRPEEWVGSWRRREVQEERWGSKKCLLKAPFKGCICQSRGNHTRIHSFGLWHQQRRATFCRQATGSSPLFLSSSSSQSLWVSHLCCHFAKKSPFYVLKWVPFIRHVQLLPSPKRAIQLFIISVFFPACFHFAKLDTGHFK